MDLSEDVLFPDGINNMGGITKRAFLAFVSDFTSIAVPIADPLTYSDRVSIATAHVLAVGKKMVELYVMYDASGVESASAGGRKGKSFTAKATLMYPGTDAECLGFFDVIKNADLILFLEEQDGDDGYIQIGTERLPASVTGGSVKTGNKPDDAKGISFEVSAPSQGPYYKYTAVLPRVGVA
jgi:hypothetical protein